MAELFRYNEKTGMHEFTGNELKCYLPERYKARNMLYISDKVSVLGVFTMIADGKTYGLNLPSMINIVPSELNQEVVNDKKYYVCVLHKGDVIHDNNLIIKKSTFGYNIWMEFLTQDNRPTFLNYNNIISLYDDVPKVCGLSLPNSHVLFEIVYAHMYRDKKNPSVPVRLTDMKGEMTVVNLHDVSFGATTTHSRIFGAYDAIGMNAALVNKETKNNELEDIFRQ